MAHGREKGRQPPKRWKRIYLREWLERTGKTQTGLADATDLSETIISLIANGKRRHNLEAAADRLGPAIEPSNLLHPPHEGGVWAACNSLDADGRKTVLFAIRNRARR